LEGRIDVADIPPSELAPQFVEVLDRYRLGLSEA
jgi:hypothetical protein